MQKNIFRLLIFLTCFVFIFILIITGGCMNETTHKRLEQIKCKSNYSLLDKVKFFNSITDKKYFTKFHEGTDKLNHFLITENSIYDSIFNKNRPFGAIDFSKNNILGIYEFTNGAIDIEFQSYVCFNDSAKKWMFTVEYLLKGQGQIKSSKLQNFYVFFWAVTPKLPKGYDVEYIIKDIDPAEQVRIL